MPFFRNITFIVIFTVMPSVAYAVNKDLKFAPIILHATTTAATSSSERALSGEGDLGEATLELGRDVFTIGRILTYRARTLEARLEAWREQTHASSSASIASATSALGVGRGKGFLVQGKNYVRLSFIWSLSVLLSSRFYFYFGVALPLFIIAWFLFFRRRF